MLNCPHSIRIRMTGSGKFVPFPMLNTHKPINNNTNTNRNTTGHCRHRYERVYFFQPSVTGDTRRDTQFLKAYANNTMLTLPPLSLPVEIRKSQPHASTAENSTIVFSKSSNIRTISSGHDVIHTPATFPVWGFIRTDEDRLMLYARV